MTDDPDWYARYRREVEAAYVPSNREPFLITLRRMAAALNWVLRDGPLNYDEAAAIKSVLHKIYEADLVTRMKQDMEQTP